MSHGRYDEGCDVFANSLAILFGIAEKRSKKILKYFFRKRVSNPYPVKVLNPPIFKPGLSWRPYLDSFKEKFWRSPPFCYHNGGIWPFVGGFYILALAKAGRKKEAKKELEKLAQANKLGRKQEWEFNEWLHGKTGKPGGSSLQSWSAAGYILAYKAVVENKLIL